MPVHAVLEACAPNPDTALIARVRAGEPLAFEPIMRRHNRRLYRLARSITGNDAEAEDVVQETYLRAYEKLDDFIGPNGFAAWLARIATNEALGRLRRRGRVILLDDHRKGGDSVNRERGIESMETHQPGPERLAANSELRRLLEHAIDTLPDEFRTVFVLRAVEGMSVVETADSLDIRPETVKTRFHRARQRLQETLGAQFDALMPAAYEFGGSHCDRVVASVLARIAPPATGKNR